MIHTLRVIVTDTCHVPCISTQQTLASTSSDNTARPAHLALSTREAGADNYSVAQRHAAQGPAFSPNPRRNCPVLSVASCCSSGRTASCVDRCPVSMEACSGSTPGSCPLVGVCNDEDSSVCFLLLFTHIHEGSSVCLLLYVRTRIEGSSVCLLLHVMFALTKPYMVLA